MARRTRRVRLDIAAPRPPVSELCKYLFEEINVQLASHREADNVVRDKDAIWRIGCCERLLEVLGYRWRYHNSPYREVRT
jgi:hypothetical protein